MAFTIKQHDTLPPLRAALLEADGSPIDLTDATGVQFVMLKDDGSYSLKNACTIVDVLGGIVEYEWQVGDTSTEGTYNAEFEINWGTGIQTVPNDTYLAVMVVHDLG